MGINVGSKNKTKIEAVELAFGQSALFKNAEIFGVEVVVPEFGHPKNLKEVVAGAVERAKQAFKNCDYSVGIEGGLMEFPGTKTGFMEISLCAIYDGKQTHLGLSPGYEWPHLIIDGIINKGLDASQALKATGITTHDKIGTAQGGVSILSKGKINRKEYNRLAIIMALIHLENPNLYE